MENKISFCYSKMIDIDLELKGNKNMNNNCDGCLYFDFCLKDVSDIKSKGKVKSDNKSDNKTKEKEDTSSKESVKSNNSDFDTENKETSSNTTKIKSNEGNTKKPKKKKETIEDLMGEDIF